MKITNEKVLITSQARKMCIRDRVESKESFSDLLDGFYEARDSRDRMRVKSQSLTTVSYTHLDVYKRQVLNAVADCLNFGNRILLFAFEVEKFCRRCV